MDKKRLAEVVALAQGGNAAAMQELYLDSSKSVYYLALKMLRNAADAEDITQDVFVTVFEKIGELREPASYYRWLNLIAANKCTNALTRKRELPGRDQDEAERFDMEEDDSFFLPERSFDDAETRRMILEIVESLPTPQRLCVFYYYYQRLTIAQIAENLECSEGTVKSRLSLARAKIRAELERKNKEEGIRLYGVPMALTPILSQTMQDFSIPADATARMWNNVLNSIPTLPGPSGHAKPPGPESAGAAPEAPGGHVGGAEPSVSGAMPHDAAAGTAPAGQTLPQSPAGRAPLSQRIPTTRPRASGPSARGGMGAEPPSASVGGQPMSSPSVQATSPVAPQETPIAPGSGPQNNPPVPHGQARGSAPLRSRIPSAPPRSTPAVSAPPSQPGPVSHPSQPPVGPPTQHAHPPQPPSHGRVEKSTPPHTKKMGGPKGPQPRRPVGLMLCSLLLTCATIGLSLHVAASGAFGKVFGRPDPTSLSSGGASSAGFPIGYFVRTDSEASLTLGEFGADLLGRHHFQINATGRFEGYRCDGDAELIADFAPSGERLAMAVLYTDYGPLNLYAIPDDRLLLESTDDWEVNVADRIADPSGVYKRAYVSSPLEGDESSEDEESSEPSVPEQPEPRPPKPPPPPGTSIKLSGLYEIVDSGISDEAAFRDYYTKTYRALIPSLTDSDITALTDTLRILLTDCALGTVGSASMSHNTGWSSAPDMTYITYEAHGQLTTVGDVYKSYITSHMPEIAKISSLNIGYEFGEGQYFWTDYDTPAGYGLAFDQTVTEDGSTTHISGEMTLTANVAEAHLSHVELEMDLITRENGSVDADGYLTVHTKAGEYITYHIVLEATLGRLHGEPVNPEPRAYVTFVDREELLGDKICLELDQSISRQPDGTYRVEWVRKGLAPGYIPVTIDLYEDAKALYEEKQKAMGELGVQTP